MGYPNETSGQEYVNATPTDSTTYSTPSPAGLPHPVALLKSVDFMDPGKPEEYHFTLQTVDEKYKTG